MVETSSLPEFGDFDDQGVYKEFFEAAVRRDTKNFVIEFNSTKAYAARDLDDASIKQLLQVEVNRDLICIHAIKDEAGHVQSFKV